SNLSVTASLVVRQFVSVLTSVCLASGPRRRQPRINSIPQGCPSDGVRAVRSQRHATGLTVPISPVSSLSFSSQLCRLPRPSPPPLPEPIPPGTHIECGSPAPGRHRGGPARVWGCRDCAPPYSCQGRVASAGGRHP